ncbi:hypothetical protein FACS1894152_0160 [Bacilli bacterium]|nr:hypothetical protein FACS1894152_0160 [Bacilli bacterium]
MSDVSDDDECEDNDNERECEEIDDGGCERVGEGNDRSPSLLASFEATDRGVVAGAGE